MRFSIALGISLLLYLNAQCQPADRIKEFRFPLGDDVISYFTTTKGEYRKAVFINLHENERTSLDAAKSVLPAYTDYRLVELRYRGQRNLEFKQRGRTFSVDPNRMFTKDGIRLTLERNSDEVRPYAVRMVNRHAKKLKRNFFNQAGIVIALHNNTEANYSVLGYGPGGPDAPDVEELHINPDHDPDNFFYTTDHGFFQYARSKGFNAVLQKSGNVKDDGSLSVYCGLRKIPYINIEAQHGHLTEQESMTRVVLDYLRDKP